jgi:hypothetical protein
VADLLISTHAVERYIERVRPDLSFEVAANHLRVVAPRAILAKKRAPTGDRRYELDDCFLVVRPAREGGMIAITTYPKPGAVWIESHAEDWSSVITDDIREAVGKFQPLIAPEGMEIPRRDQIEALKRRLDKQTAHGRRMSEEREEARQALRRVAPWLPDTPEVRAALGRLADCVWPPRA